VLLRHPTPLAQVRGAYNAIRVVGDAVGDTLYYGQGAGQMPTASAVVADLIDLAVGRAQCTFQTLQLWSGSSRGIQLRPSTTVPSRFYLRLLVKDRPGVLAEAARELAMSLAQGPSVTLGYIKRNINNAETMTLEACFDGEAIHHSRAGETADHKEAAKAFVEKRKPVFSGH